LAKKHGRWPKHSADGENISPLGETCRRRRKRIADGRNISPMAKLIADGKIVWPKAFLIKTDASWAGTRPSLRELLHSYT